MLWQLEGAPEAFKDLKLPSIFELGQYIPIPSNTWNAFWQFKVRAFQFGQHNYNPIKLSGIETQSPTEVI